ncbi:MAG: transglycosylase SLT domain-containing protein [Mariprofundaceae bacterium]
MQKYIITLGLFWVVTLQLLVPQSAQALGAASIEQQRVWFLQARQALRDDDQIQFKTAYDKLKSYPLRPYLDIWQAWKHVDDDLNVLKALEQYESIPESEDLRLAWIKSLSDRGQWPHVARVFNEMPASRKKRPKLSLLSAWYNNDKPQAFKLLETQWEKGKNIKVYQAPLLKEQWHKAGFPHLEATRMRGAYFAKRGKWKEINLLKADFNSGDRQLLSIWQAMQKKPASLSPQLLASYEQHVWYGLIVEDVLRRLSRKDMDASWNALTQMQPTLPVARFEKIQRNIALRGAKQQHLAAQGWLDSLSLAVQTAETRAWSVRLLLVKQDWEQVLDNVSKMPKWQQDESRWLYWRAIALSELDQAEQAKLILESLALGRGYYSFLSADRLGQAYRMGAVDMLQEGKASLLNKPFMRRAYEWLQLQEPGKAGREWQQGMRGMPLDIWKQALQLAASWGWYDRVIQAASKADAFDALALRFPMGFSSEVNDAAGLKGLDHSLLWSVIRQESVFNARAISRVGAQGLMQLMPSTAKYVAKKHGVKRSESKNLLNPAVNIRLGSLYLSDLLQRFDGNRALAVAAYNAGSTRVKRWRKRLAFKHADIWVELIPFNETRRYVQQVLAFTAVYDWLQNKQASPLMASMHESAIKL